MPEEGCQAELAKRFDKNKKDDVINPIVNNINKDFVVGMNFAREECHWGTWM